MNLRYHNVAGIPILVEVEVDGVRGGPGWSCRHQNPYGRIPSTVGADGEQLDVYLASTFPTDSGQIHRITQVKPDGAFDEHKFMVGFDSPEAAEAAYKAHMPEDRFGGMDSMTTDEFHQRYLDGEQEGNIQETTMASHPVVALEDPVRNQPDYGEVEQHVSDLQVQVDEHKAEEQALRDEVGDQAVSLADMIDEFLGKDASRPEHDDNYLASTEDAVASIKDEYSTSKWDGKHVTDELIDDFAANNGDQALPIQEWWDRWDEFMHAHEQGLKKQRQRDLKEKGNTPPKEDGEVSGADYRDAEGNSWGFLHGGELFGPDGAYAVLKAVDGPAKGEKRNVPVEELGAKYQEIKPGTTAMKKRADGPYLTADKYAETQTNNRRLIELFDSFHGIREDIEVHTPEEWKPIWDHFYAHRADYVDDPKEVDAMNKQAKTRFHEDGQGNATCEDCGSTEPLSAYGEQDQGVDVHFGVCPHCGEGGMMVKHQEAQDAAPQDEFWTEGSKSSAKDFDGMPLAVGDRVEMSQPAVEDMLPDGSGSIQGTIESIDENGYVHVKWDDGDSANNLTVEEALRKIGAKEHPAEKAPHAEGFWPEIERQYADDLRITEVKKGQEVVTPNGLGVVEDVWGDGTRTLVRLTSSGELKPYVTQRLRKKEALVKVAEDFPPGTLVQLKPEFGKKGVVLYATPYADLMVSWSNGTNQRVNPELLQKTSKKVTASQLQVLLKRAEEEADPMTEGLEAPPEEADAADQLEMLNNTPPAQGGPPQINVIVTNPDDLDDVMSFLNELDEHEENELEEPETAADVVPAPPETSGLEETVPEEDQEKNKEIEGIFDGERVAIRKTARWVMAEEIDYAADAESTAPSSEDLQGAADELRQSVNPEAGDLQTRVQEFNEKDEDLQQALCDIRENVDDLQQQLDEGREPAPGPDANDNLAIELIVPVQENMTHSPELAQVQAKHVYADLTFDRGWFKDQNGRIMNQFPGPDAVVVDTETGDKGHVDLGGTTPGTAMFYPLGGDQSSARPIKLNYPTTAKRKTASATVFGQHVKTSSAYEQSSDAAKASQKARESSNRHDHSVAADAHERAMRAHIEEGNKSMAEEHAEKVNYHKKLSISANEKARRVQAEDSSSEIVPPEARSANEKEQADTEKDFKDDEQEIDRQYAGGTVSDLADPLQHLWAEEDAAPVEARRVQAASTPAQDIAKFNQLIQPALAASKKMSFDESGEALDGPHLKVKVQGDTVSADAATVDAMVLTTVQAKFVGNGKVEILDGQDSTGGHGFDFFAGDKTTVQEFAGQLAGVVQEWQDTAGDEGDEAVSDEDPEISWGEFYQKIPPGSKIPQSFADKHRSETYTLKDWVNLWAKETGLPVPVKANKHAVHGACPVCGNAYEECTCSDEKKASIHLAYVRQVGSEWGVYSKAGDLLGKHKTKEDADAQLRAIEVHKHGVKVPVEVLAEMFNLQAHIDALLKRRPDLIPKWEAKFAGLTKTARGKGGYPGGLNPPSWVPWSLRDIWRAAVERYVEEEGGNLGDPESVNAIVGGDDVYAKVVPVYKALMQKHAPDAPVSMSPSVDPTRPAHRVPPPSPKAVSMEGFDPVAAALEASV